MKRIMPVLVLTAAALGSVDKLIVPEAGSGDMYEAEIAC